MINKETEQQDLIKRQIKTISDLQDKIKLQNFDLSKLRHDNYNLRQKLQARNKVIREARKELLSIYYSKKYERISIILKMLRVDIDEQE